MNLQSSSDMIPAKDTLVTIQPQDLAKSSAVRMDVRTNDAFVGEKLPGSVSLCIYEVSFLENVKKAFPELDTELVVYGSSSEFFAAAVAAERLKDAGYSNVALLEGGIEAWKDAGLALDDRSQKEESESMAGVYELDVELSRVRWIGRNLSNQHEGTIACQTGSIEINDRGTLAKGEVVLDMTKIECSDLSDSALNRMLVSHLQSIDFFQTDAFPTASFSIDRYYPNPDATPGMPNANVEGTMLVRSRKQQLGFLASLARWENGYVFQAQFDVDRTRFGAVYGSGRIFEFLGKHLVNDLVNIQVMAFFRRSSEA